MAGGKRPVSRPANERGFKAKFGYDDRKGVGACYRSPSGWDDASREAFGGCLRYDAKACASLCNIISFTG